MSERQTIASTPSPALPKKIKRSQVIEACRVLGLDPYAVSELRITPSTIVLEWWPVPGEDKGGLSVAFDAHLSGGKRTPAFGDTFERVR